MKNKGQVTFFILLSLFLVIIFGFYFYSNTFQDDDAAVIEAQRSNLNSQPIYIYTEECIKNAAFQASAIFGFQQGYHIPPNTSLDTIFNFIAYYYLKGSSLIPDNEFFEEEFSKIMNDQIVEQCTNFSIFEERGFDINFDNINTETTILEDTTIIKVDYPISIKIGNTLTDISKFSYTLPVRLGHILDISRTLVEEIKREPYAVDLTFLLDQDVDISITRYDACNKVYIIIDDQSETKIEDEFYAYSFAVGFNDEFCVETADFEEIELPEIEVENNNPILDPIPNLDAETDKEFTYRLIANDPDEDLVFYLATDILTNHTNVLTGLINFTPSESDKGIHLVTITAVDTSGGFDQKEFYLTIE